MSTAEPTVPRIDLAQRLRALRKSAKPELTAEQVAAQLYWNRTKISQIETAKTGIREADLRTLLAFYEVTDPAMIDEYLALAREGKTRGWWSPYSPIIGGAYSHYIGLESGARSLECYEAQIVHGLLQTEAYAEAVISQACPDDPISVIKGKVKLRRERQERARSKSLGLRMVFDESVLRRAIGGVDVMRGQLEYLINAAESDHISIRVIPHSAGIYPGMLSSFTKMQLSGGLPDVIYVEGLTGDVFPPVEDRSRYSVAFATLRDVALDAASSMRLMESALRELNR